MNWEAFATPEESKQFALFLHQLRERGRRPQTLKAYQLDWSQFAKWYTLVNQERFILARLTSMDVQDYLTWGQQQGLKATTLNRRLALLKQYAAWGTQAGILSKEMRQRIKAVPIQRKQQLAPRSLTTPEARKLLREVKVRGNPRDEAILSLLLYTGLRVGELVALCTHDVSLSERKGVVHIRAQMAKGARNGKYLCPRRHAKLCKPT